MDIDKLIDIANHMFDVQKFEEAVQLYSVALKKDADCMEAWAGRACAHNSSKAWTPSIEDSSKAIALGCNDASIYYNRSNAYWCLQKHQQAIDDATVALSLQPLFPEALCCRGAAFNATSQWDDAIADFTKALEILPRFPIARCSRGIAFCQKQEWAMAVQDLSIAVQESPQYAFAVDWLARAKVHLAEAEKVAEKAAEDMMRSLVEENASVVGAATISKGKKRSRQKKKKPKLPSPPSPQVEQAANRKPQASPRKGEGESEGGHNKIATKKAGAAGKIEMGGGGISTSARPKSKLQQGPSEPHSTSRLKTKAAPVALQQEGEPKSSLSPRKKETKTVKQSLHADLRMIEVTAMVEAAITVGTAKALGARIDGPHTPVSQELCLAAATQMQNQTKNYLIGQVGFLG